MRAELRQGENFISFSDFWFSEQDKAVRSPYNTEFSVRVSSGAFAGEGEWVCDRTAITAFAAVLAEVYHFSRDSAVLTDISCGSRLELLMDKTGHLTVSGTVYGSRMEQTLQFRFEADQTVLRDFLAAWQRIDAEL